MRIPLILRIGALVLATTGFYTYVGQMVPQKEVLPPKETAIKSVVRTITYDGQAGLESILRGGND